MIILHKIEFFVKKRKIYIYTLHNTSGYQRASKALLFFFFKQ